MEISAGRIVFSKCGRDKGLPFIIVEVCDGYVFLADGKLRPLANPKRKKLKHIQPTNASVPDIASPVGTLKTISDSDARKALAAYRDRS